MIGKHFNAQEGHTLNPEKINKNVRAGKRLSHTVDPEEYETDKMGRAKKGATSNMADPDSISKELIGKHFNAQEGHTLNPEKIKKNVRAGKRLSHTVDPE